MEAATADISSASARLDELIRSTSEDLPVVQFHVAEKDILRSFFVPKAYFVRSFASCFFIDRRADA